MKKISLTVWMVLGVFLFFSYTEFTNAEVPATTYPSVASAVDNIPYTVYMFGRDDCGFCKKEKEFLTNEGINYQYLNIVSDSEARDLYDKVVAKHNMSKVTPVTVIGSVAFSGFNGPDITGKEIKLAIEETKRGNVRTIEEHLALAPAQNIETGQGCDIEGCELTEPSYTFEIPFVGLVDLKEFSLFSLSLILGTIDGFNPCAMWVLLTFLAILAQAGSRKKMIFLAGTFIVAEAVMYNLILNVWYKTWDFVALDQIVTPLVGFISLGGGIFFIWRWYKNRNATLVCDITSIDSQTRTIDKFKFLASQPVTITTVFAILVIAFSVNVIEFACSIGIPQAYTKILELNMLGVLERQWYILVYTFGYIVDDLVVFALAIWGYNKLQATGQKYAHLSLLLGGLLMLILGSLLIINPSLLVL